MKLYTRTGDDGTTGLFGGGRVRKDDLRIEAYGTIDELNAHVGAACGAMSSSSDAAKWRVLIDRLTTIQSELFNIGAELATPRPAEHADRVPVASDSDISRLEQWIDEATAQVAPLRAFVLPGGSSAACALHICRTVCRRAERRVISLTAAEQISPVIVIYLNRLSDLLFAWARWANKLAGVADVPWVNPKQG